MRRSAAGDAPFPPARGNCYDARCPAREVLGHVTGRWGGLVLGALIDGSQRFSELRLRIDGISEKMLAQTLRDLERDGLVRRHEHPALPRHVDYTLTPTGIEVARRLRDLMTWLEDRVHTFVAAQEADDLTSDRAQTA